MNTAVLFSWRRTTKPGTEPCEPGIRGGHEAMTCPNCSGHEVRCLSLDTGELWNHCLECHHDWSEFPDSREGTTLPTGVLHNGPIHSISRMTKVYIAGPLRAETPYLVEQNVRQARDVAELLWKEGFAVFCPHLNTYGMVGMLGDEKAFIEGDLLFLEACDAVVLLEGWQDSVGASLESAKAKELGIPRILRGRRGQIHWRERITEAIKDAVSTKRPNPAPASVSERTP